MIALALWSILAYVAIVAGMLGLDWLFAIAAPLIRGRRCPARFGNRRCRGVLGHVDRWHECGEYWWSP